MIVRLTCELVPSSSWFSNVRSNVSSKEWDMIRRGAYKKAGHECQICQQKGMIHCHEIWEYNDKNHIQKLVDMMVLCPSCHQVKHIGFASMNGKYEEAVVHLAKINNWSVTKARQYVAEQFDIWRERSKFKWILDISYLDKQYGIKINGNKMETNS